MNNEHTNISKAPFITVRMPKKNEFMISHFVGVIMMVSMLVMSLLVLAAFFMKAPVKIFTAVVATLLLTFVFALVAIIVGVILRRFNFRLNSLFKYLVLFVVGTISAFLTIGALELWFVTYTPSVLIGLSAVSIIFWIVVTISGKFSIPKE